MRSEPSRGRGGRRKREMKPDRIQFWERLVKAARKVLEIAEGFLRSLSKPPGDDPSEG